MGRSLVDRAVEAVQTGNVAELRLLDVEITQRWFDGNRHVANSHKDEVLKVTGELFAHLGVHTTGVQRTQASSRWTKGARARSTIGKRCLSLGTV